MTPPMFRTPNGAADAAVGEVLTLTGSEGHHAADVRRLRTGEPVMLTDGVGALILGKVAAVRKGELEVEVLGSGRRPAPQPRITVVQAMAKGGRDEDAVESMTEVGVDAIVGWQASRSIAKWNDRTHARWGSTAVAAAKQSRRCWWPTIVGPATTDDVVALLAEATLGLVLCGESEDALGAHGVPAEGEIVVVVGPEGGITDEEIDRFATAGADLACIGDTVLRSSTAGVVALSILMAQTRWRY